MSCSQSRRLEKNSYQKVNRIVDKHSRKSHKYEFSMKSLTFSYLICLLNPYFSQKLLAKTKSRKKLLKSCRAQLGQVYCVLPLESIFTCKRGHIIIIPHLSRRPRKRPKTTRLVSIKILCPSKTTKTTLTTTINMAQPTGQTQNSSDIG